MYLTITSLNHADEILRHPLELNPAFRTKLKEYCGGYSQEYSELEAFFTAHPFMPKDMLNGQNWIDRELGDVKTMVCNGNLKGALPQLRELKITVSAIDFICSKYCLNLYPAA